MLKRTLALVGAIVLAAVVPAGAQSTSLGQPITLLATASGPVPPGLAGVRMAIVCKDLASPQSITSRSVDVTFAAAETTYLEVVPPNSTSLPVVVGSTCEVTATLIGTASLSSGLLSIVVGGIDRTGAQSLTSTGAATVVSSLVSGSSGSTYVPVFGAATISVVVAFPVFVVKKAVVGTEAVPGSGYTVAVECFTSKAMPFVATTALAGGYSPGDLVVPDRRSVVLTVNGSGVRVFDATAEGVIAPDRLGTAANLASLFPPGARTSTEQAAAAIYTAIFLPARPSSASFTLRKGASRAISADDVPGLTSSSACRFVETNAMGASLVASSAGGDYVQRGSSTAFVTDLVSIGTTVTITNTFYGRLAVGVASSGDSGSAVRTFGVRVRCEQIGLDDSFVLRSGQSKVYDNIIAGTLCAVTEPKTDGATLRITDNSGPAVDDGIVVLLPLRLGCSSAYPEADGAGTFVVPPDNSCLSVVLLSNAYPAAVPPATGTPPPVAPGTTASAAAATTTAPAVVSQLAATSAPTIPAADTPTVTPAPATPVDATPTFTG